LDKENLLAFEKNTTKIWYNENDPRLYVNEEQDDITRLTQEGIALFGAEEFYRLMLFSVGNPVAVEYEEFYSAARRIIRFERQHQLIKKVKETQ